jgi:hypothetical protein
MRLPYSPSTRRLALVGTLTTKEQKHDGQDLVFPAAKTDFEGGVDGRGCFD